MSRNDDWNDKDIVSAFFKMVYTLGLWIFWLMFTIYWGIARDWAFFDHSGVPIWQHILFFVWLIGTLPLMIWVTRTKIWKL